LINSRPNHIANIKTALQGEEREVLSDLSKYCEVDRLNMESYCPEDASVVHEQADQLILWTQSARKQLMEVRMNTRGLYKEQKQNEESARAMSIILDAVEEMKEQRAKEFFSSENHIRAMLSLVSSLRHQMAATPHTIISEKPQSTSHAELEPSSDQIESHITRVRSGLQNCMSCLLMINIFKFRSPMDLQAWRAHAIHMKLVYLNFKKKLKAKPVLPRH
jgi:uncharacterized protein YgfB (UPF0149 family)